MDTNVLVSAFATRGLSADVARVVIAEHELATSEVVIEELRRVLRDKIDASPSAIDGVVTLLRRHCVAPAPAESFPLDIRDRADEWVVASVVASGADICVTGDRELLGAGSSLEGVPFMSPREFWEMLSSSGPT